MTVCDLSAFYCEKGGGVTTFHRARLEWFARQTRHRYVLIAPGPATASRQLAPSASIVSIAGPRASRESGRYHLLTNYRAVREAVEHHAPDVLEAHDPWFSLPMGLHLRFRGPYRGLLTTHCHSDPIGTYVHPRVARWRWLGRAVARAEHWADRQLHRQHAACHAVYVASETMRRHLADVGVSRVFKSGFGVDADLLRLSISRRPSDVRGLLYAGRLDDDKEFTLLLRVLPRLLERSDVRVTVAGTGRYAAHVAAISHPRFRYLGHIRERAAMRTLYAANDVLVAPGRYETFGLAALEGAAAGLLVVGPSAGGTGELLASCQSPLTFAPGSADALFETIVSAFDREHRDVVQRGRAMARRFGTWSDVVGRQVAGYQAMLGQTDQPACLTA